jgi:hypothetical protein
MRPQEQEQEQEQVEVEVAVAVAGVARPQHRSCGQPHWVAEEGGFPCEPSPNGLCDATTGR